MPVKSKAASKPSPVVKKTPAIKSNKKLNSKQEDFANLSEDIIANVSVGIYIIKNGNFVYASPLFQRLSGYSHSDLLGTNPLDHVHPEDRETVRQNAIKSLKGKGGSYEYRFRRKNGESIWVLERVASITYKGKRAVLGSFMDITEHKRMEETLLQSEEKYRNILENIEDGYAELDLRGNFIFFNEALCRIQGYTRDELMKLNYRDLMDEENAKKIYQKYNKVYTTGKSEKEVPYEIMTKSGMRRYLETSITPMKDASGRIFAFRGIVRDRTERRKVEESLHQSEEKYRNILENMQEAYYEIDLNGKFTFVNDTVCRHLGYTREELLGMNNRQVQDEKTAKRIYQMFIEIYKTGEPVKAIEAEYVRKDGTKGTYELSVSLIRDASGKPSGFRGISRDITERKQHDAELALFRSAMDVSQDMIFLVDRTTMRFLYANDTALRLTGYTREEYMKLSPQDMLLVDRKTLEHAYDEAIAAAPSGITVEMRSRTKDGTRTIIELHRRALNIGNRWIIVTITHDISQRWLAEQSVLLLGRMFAALSATNETILHAKSPEELYQRVCDAAVDGGKFITTGILLFDPGTTWVRVAAASGAGMASLRKARISLDESIPEGKGLVGTAFRTGKPCVSNDYLKDAVSLAWRENAEKVGSAAVVPLLRNGQSIGALIFYAAEKRAFDGEIVKLLESMAENVLFALDNFERGAERKLLEEKIRQSEERYRTIIEEMEEWYFETDLTGNITFFNDIFSNVLGYSQKELTGLNFRDFIKKEDLDSVYRLFNQVFKTGKSTKNFPYEFIRTDGTVTSAEFSIFPKWDKEAKIVGFRGVGHDITERKRAEERIQYLATHDALTGLPNRLMFSQLLNHAIQSAQRHQRQLAVFFIDLDRFKIINDTLGHEAGDQLLQEIALRFKQSLRAVDIVARLGGDEFVILIEEINDMEQVATVAHKILTAAIKPVILLREECRVTASIGISMYPKDAEDDQSLMKNADIAMYLAKEEGKNNYQFYSKDIQSKSIERLSIESNLRFALEKNELSLHYQAKVDFKTNTITGVEALLRWQNPSLGSVTPTQFIPVAEESGLIIPIGRWVMRTACAQNVAWQREGLPPVCMAVNLSLRQLTDEFLIEDIKKALNDSGMAPNMLELEITESMVMHNPTRMIAVLTKIKNLGVRLAIDDFGTGYSSLAQIKHFPVDTLKVDRSFIRNIPQDAEDKAITEAIIAMGKTLSLTVVAEGVETLEQMDFLKDHSCDEMQGYYFSKPIVPEQFADLLRKHVPTPQK